MYRVKDENLKFINSYKVLKGIISSYLNNKNKNSKDNKDFINKNTSLLIDLDQRFTMLA